MRLVSLLLLATLCGATTWAWEQPATCPPVARPPAAAEAEAAAKDARDRGFLWRLSKDGRDSFLYGTIHVGRSEWVFPGPEVLRALRSTDIVALELDVLDPKIGEALQRGTTRKPDQELPPNLAARLRAQLVAACLPEDLLRTTSPVMLATSLTVVAARWEGLDPAFAVDAVYAGLARELKKPVSSLETVDLQLGLLLGQSEAEATAAVESALTDLEKGKAAPMIARMASMWAEGRLSELENYEDWCACLDTEEDRRMMKRLLDDRNPGLAASIDQLHTGGQRVFAAVGSLHMIGPMGLPALLAKRGYRVERVAFGARP